MKLTDIQDSLAKTPPGTLSLPPEVWATTWDERPTEPVVVGLRLLSEYDRREALKQARSNAAKSERPEESFDDAAVRLLVAVGICDPNDATATSSLFPYPHDQVFLLLTESGARYIFDAMQKLEVEISPRFLEADADDIVELVEMLASGGVEALDDQDRGAALRHLRYVFDILAEAQTDASSVA